MVTKVAALIGIIDDIYDIYGTLEELELFTNVIERLVSMSLHFKCFWMFIFDLKNHSLWFQMGYKYNGSASILYEDVLPYPSQLGQWNGFWHP